MTDNTNNATISIATLPHGAISEIGSRCGVSRKTVYKVLNNIDTYSGNKDIFSAVVKEATNIINQRQATLKEAKDPFIKALQGCKI